MHNNFLSRVSFLHRYFLGVHLERIYHIICIGMYKYTVMKESWRAHEGIGDRYCSEALVISACAIVRADIEFKASLKSDFR